MKSVLRRVTSIGCVLCLAASVTPVLAASPSMQATEVGAADIDDLEERVTRLATAIDDVRSEDATQAEALQAELDELESEVVYLRVKLRKEGELSAQEVADVRDQLEDLEDRATAPPAEVPPAPPGTAARTIPVGQEIDVRLQTRLSSETAEVEDRFDATTLVDLSHGDDLLIPAGSVLGGVVRSVERATRTSRRGRLTLAFDTLEIDGETYTIRATVTDALESEGLKGEAGRATAGAVAGAIIGGILGGGKGALAGLVIGGGGTIMATPGQNVSLDAGTVLRARFDSALTLGPPSQ